MRKFHLLFFVAAGNIFTLQAQTSITSATFGMMEARHIGPGTMSGRISAIDLSLIHI